MPGASYNAHILVAEQTAVGTAATPNLAIPRKTESLKLKRTWTKSGTPWGSREVLEQHKGIKEGGGQLGMDLYLGIPGWFLKWLFGTVANGALTSAAVPGSITATPTGTPATGGTIPDGTYYYQVASVYTRNSDGAAAVKWITNPKATAAVVVGTGNNTVNVAWALPSAPTGYTRVANYVYRTAAGGAASTAKFLAAVGVAVTTYSDTGAVTLSSIPVPAAVYEHTYLIASPASGVSPLRYFTLLKNMDFGASAGQRCTDCMVDKATINSPNNPSGPVSLQFDVKYLNEAEASEISPSYTLEQASVAWQTQCLIDGTRVAQTKQWQVEVSNSLEFLPQLANTETHRGIAPGARTVASGSVTFQAENHAEWLKMVAGTAVAVQFYADGGDTTATAAVTAESATSWPYMLDVHLPSCRYDDAGANQSEDKLMEDPVKFNCKKDATAGYSIRLRLYNTTASYPDAA